jgi:hypothetical protein
MGSSPSRDTVHLIYWPKIKIIIVHLENEANFIALFNAISGTDLFFKKCLFLLKFKEQPPPVIQNSYSIVPGSLDTKRAKKVVIFY